MGEVEKLGDAGANKGGVKAPVTVVARVEFIEPVSLGAERAGAYRGDTWRERDGVMCFYTKRGELGANRDKETTRHGVLIPWANVKSYEAVG